MSDYDDIKRDVRDLRKELDETKEDVTTIKTHVTNHIPHVLEDIQKSIAKLDSRVKPFETKETKRQGVNEFLSILLKAVCTLAALTWTVIQIVSKL